MTILKEVLKSRIRELLDSAPMTGSQLHTELGCSQQRISEALNAIEAKVIGMSSQGYGRQAPVYANKDHDGSMNPSFSLVLKRPATWVFDLWEAMGIELPSEEEIA